MSGHIFARRRFSRFALAAGMICIVVAAGCGRRSINARTNEAFHGVPQWAGNVGKRLDVVARGIEEFGTISVSSPLLAPPATQPFTFTLGKKPDDYFNDAKNQVQGRAAVFDQFARESGISTRVQADIATTLTYLADLQAYGRDVAAHQQKQQLNDLAARLEAQRIIATLPADATEEQRLAAEAQAAQLLQDRLSGPASRPSYPEAPQTTPATTDDDLAASPQAAKDVLTSPTFTAIRGLLSGDAPALSNRAAINIAAGDTATAAIFNLLSVPSQYTEKFKDKVIMFGASMVAVSPGWRTREEYAADVSVNVAYRYQPARQELLNKLYASVAKSKVPFDRALKECLQKTGRVEAEQLQANEPQATPEETGVADELLSGSASPGEDDGGLASAAEKRGAPLNLLFQATNPGPSDPAEKDASMAGMLRRPSAREISAPLVAAVSPMSEAEVMDLTSSVRQQRAFALAASLALQYAGLKGQAEVFDKWVKRLEQDVQTRGASVAVSTYSFSGGTFGFQVGPRLRALANPGDSKSRSANVLERQTFPTLIVIGLEQEDLRVRFSPDKDRKKLNAYEPVLVFRQTTRWLPLKAPDRLALPFREPEDAQRVSEVSRMQWAAGLSAARDDIDSPLGAQLQSKLRRAADVLQAMVDNKGKTFNHLRAGGADPNDFLTLHLESPVFAALDRRMTTADAERVRKWLNTNSTAADTARVVIDKQTERSASSLQAALSDLASTNFQQQASKGLKDYLRQRVSLFENAAIGSTVEQYLPISLIAPVEPEPKKVKVNAVAELLHGFTDRPSVFFVTGENLSLLGPQARAKVGRQRAKLQLLGDKAAVIIFTPPMPFLGGAPLGSPKSAETITIVGSGPAGAIYPVGAVIFDQPPPEPGVMTGVDITRDSAGRITGVVIKMRDKKNPSKFRALQPHELRELLEEIMRGDPNVKLNIDTSGKFKAQVDSSTQLQAPPPPQ